MHIIVILIFMAFNGIFQSTVLPGSIGIIGNWFSNSNLGLIYGLWTGCKNFGDIIGYYLGAFIIDKMHYSAFMAILIVGIFMILMGILCMIFVKDSPTNKHVSSRFIEDVIIHVS